jgi:pimeloyl-ACP methyl ester carboxylesterase
MDPVPPPRLAWLEAVDRFTAGIVGEEMRTRYGEAGVPRLPVVGCEDLALLPSGRKRLAASVVYLLPGGTWPGVDENGGAWLLPWALALQRLGVGRAVPLPLFAGKPPLAATFDPVLSRLTKHHEREVCDRVRQDLSAHPPGPGGGVWLLGHSYGSLLAFEAAAGLAPRLDGVVALETHLNSTRFFAPHAPAVRSVLVAESEEGYWPTVPAGTTLHRVALPGVTHMDVVLKPAAALLRAIGRAIAGDPAP